MRSSGWLHGYSFPKYQNQFESDGKRKHHSRLEVRLRHRKQKFDKKTNVSEEENSPGNYFTNSTKLFEEKSCNAFCQLDPSGTKKKYSSQKVKVPEMTHRGPLYRSRPKDILKIVLEDKTRNQSSRSLVPRPQSAPCHLLFRIKCAKQVKSVWIVDEGRRGLTEEKFETRSTRSACSCRSQDKQITTPLWPKEIGETSLQNSEEYCTEDYNIFKGSERTNLKVTKSHAGLKLNNQDYINGNNYEAMFKNIPQKCPRMHRNCNEPVELPPGDSLQSSDYPQDLINSNLILKGCEDDFSDGPFSSPERTAYQTCFKWDPVLEKKPLPSPRSNNNDSRVIGKFPRDHSCSREEQQQQQQRQQQQQPRDIANSSETVGSEKIAENGINGTTSILMEDAACSPRRPHLCCDLDIQVSENDNSYDLKGQIPKTTRSVSTQVNDELMLSARDACKIEENNRGHDDHYLIADERPQSVRCTKCKEILENENNQDCRRYLAKGNWRCQPNCNKNWIIKQQMNYDCHSEAFLADDQRRILNHCLTNAIKSRDGSSLMKSNNYCPAAVVAAAAAGIKAKNNHCCSVNGVDRNRCEERPQRSFDSGMRTGVAISSSKLQTANCKHEACFCGPRCNSNSRRVPFCYSSDNSHKIARETSSQTVFRPCLQNRKNYSDDGAERKGLKNRDPNKGRIHGDKSQWKAELLTPPITGSSIPNIKSFLPHKTGEDHHRLFFCNEILNKHQNILRSCMRNQPEDNKAHVSVVRTVEYSNSDNEWFASPEEDISVLSPRGHTFEEENCKEVDNNIDEESETLYTSAYAKALAVFQKGCPPPVERNLKKNRKHLQQNNLK